MYKYELNHYCTTIHRNISTHFLYNFIQSNQGLTSTLHRVQNFFLSYGVTAGTSSCVEWRDTPAAYRGRAGHDKSNAQLQIEKRLHTFYQNNCKQHEPFLSLVPALARVFQSFPLAKYFETKKIIFIRQRRVILLYYSTWPYEIKRACLPLNLNLMPLKFKITYVKKWGWEKKKNSQFFSTFFNALLILFNYMLHGNLYTAINLSFYLSDQLVLLVSQQMKRQHNWIRC